MKGLRQIVIAAAALSCGIAAFGAAFEKGPIELPVALPLQLSIPFSAIPADALNALDPLSKAIPAVPPALAVAAPSPMPKMSIMALRGTKASRPASESAESDRQRLGGQFDGSGELPAEPDFVPPAAIGTGGVVKAPLPNPATHYQTAYDKAVQEAWARGLGKGMVSLREVTGSIPTQGASLSYQFDIKGGKTSYRVYVDFGSAWNQPDVQIHALPSDGTITGLSSLAASAPQSVSKSVRIAPEKALWLAQEKVPGLSSQASFALKPWHENWFVYELYTNSAYVIVNARSGKVHVVRDGRRARSLARDSKISDEDVVAAARSTAHYKWKPWSQEEYELHRQEAGYHLQRRGATQAQLELFDQLLEDAPSDYGNRPGD